MGLPASIKTSLNKLSRGFEAFATKAKAPYIIIVCLYALLGYTLILLPPFLVIVASYNIYELLSLGDISKWPNTLIWLTALIISALFSYRSLKLKIPPPVGLTITEEKLPEIFKLVRKYQDHFKHPTIHRIVITANYEIDIIKVPKFALPIWSMNTLVIGLPVLLCHTPKHFNCMIARRIGQFSKRTNPVTNWIYQLRAIWKQYASAYGKLKHLDCYLLKWTYGGYASLYETISTFPARQDELNADSYVMELFNNEVIREMITADATYQWYLREHFWPTINKIALTRTKPALTPYQNITTATKTNFKEGKITFLIQKAFKSEPQKKSSTPSMLQRLDNIGHDTPAMGVNTGDTAAVKYLGASFNNVIKLIDTLWLKDNMELQKRMKKRPRRFNIFRSKS